MITYQKVCLRNSCKERKVMPIIIKVRKMAKIKKRYNQVRHPTQDQHFDRETRKRFLSIY